MSALGISLQSNVGRVADNLDQFGAELKRRMIHGALNDAIASAKTLGVRLVREDLNIKARDVNKITKLRRASHDSLRAEFVASFEPTPLYAFAPRLVRVNTRLGRRTGVSVQVQKRGPRRFVYGAKVGGGFVATMRSGKKQIWFRAGAPSKSDAKREKIMPWFGPTISQAIGSPRVARAIVERATERFDIELAQRVNRELTRR